MSNREDCCFTGDTLSTPPGRLGRERMPPTRYTELKELRGIVNNVAMRQGEEIENLRRQVLGVGGCNDDLAVVMNQLSGLATQVSRFTDFKTAAENELSIIRDDNRKIKKQMQSIQIPLGPLDAYGCGEKMVFVDDGLPPSAFEYLKPGPSDPARLAESKRRTTLSPQDVETAAEASSLHSKARTIMQEESQIHTKIDGMNHKFGRVWGRLQAVEDSLEKFSEKMDSLLERLASSADQP